MAMRRTCSADAGFDSSERLEVNAGVLEVRSLPSKQASVSSILTIRSVSQVSERSQLVVAIHDGGVRLPAPAPASRWPNGKAADCNSAVRRFDSDSRLHALVRAELGGGLLPLAYSVRLGAGAPPRGPAGSRPSPPKRRASSSILDTLSSPVDPVPALRTQVAEVRFFPKRPRGRWRCRLGLISQVNRVRLPGPQPTRRLEARSGFHTAGCEGSTPSVATRRG